MSFFETHHIYVNKNRRFQLKISKLHTIEKHLTLSLTVYRFGRCDTSWIITLKSIRFPS